VSVYLWWSSSAGDGKAKNESSMAGLLMMDTAVATGANVHGQ
jgi:hypothetical protein